MLRIIEAPEGFLGFGEELEGGPIWPLLTLMVSLSVSHGWPVQPAAKRNRFRLCERSASR